MPEPKALGAGRLDLLRLLEEGSRSMFAPELFAGMVTPSGVRKAFNKLAA